MKNETSLWTPQTLNRIKRDYRKFMPILDNDKLKCMKFFKDTYQTKELSFKKELNTVDLLTISMGSVSQNQSTVG